VRLVHLAVRTAEFNQPLDVGDSSRAAGGLDGQTTVERRRPPLITYQLYPGLRTLWETPPLYVVDDFFTAPGPDRKAYRAPRAPAGGFRRGGVLLCHARCVRVCCVCPVGGGQEDPGEGEELKDK